jgi:hypothetical protein
VHRSPPHQSRKHPRKKAIKAGAKDAGVFGSESCEMGGLAGSIQVVAAPLDVKGWQWRGGGEAPYIGSWRHIESRSEPPPAISGIGFDRGAKAA